MLTEGLLVTLHARAGKESELEEFLRSANRVVLAEPTMPASFALHFGHSDYGFLNLYSSRAGQEAYELGQVARALKERGEMLLTRWPKMTRVTVLAEKFPSSNVATQAVTKGLLLTFKPKIGHERDVEALLRDAQPMVVEEQDTVGWCAIRLDTGEYGLFDVFPDNGARFRHITGHVPRELAKHAFSLFGSFPDMDMVDVLAAKLA